MIFPIPCPICDHNSSSVGMALAHMERRHGIVPDLNGHTCARCRARFETPLEVQDHVRRKHVGYPPNPQPAQAATALQ